MRIVLSPVGSAGDVHPFLAIGQALQVRGHEVLLLASPVFRTRVETAGLRHVSFGSVADYEAAVANPAVWHPRRGFPAIWNTLLPHLLPAYHALRKCVVPGRTVMAGGSLAFSMRLLQETHGVPAATVHLSPACILSAHAPPRLPGLFDLSGWPARWVRVLFEQAERRVLDPLMAPGLDAVRAQLGLSPVRHIMGGWSPSPDRVIAAWPDWFGPPQTDWPLQALTTGFPRWNAPAGDGLDPALEVFLRNGPPPVGFTPGSAMAQGRVFFERALQACATLGLRAVLVSPYADQWPTPRPAWAHAVPYVPFERLVPRLRAWVHHGGIGTCVQGLAAGVPQGIFPFAHDQFDNAARLVRLGVAVAGAPAGSARGWTRRLRRLTGDRAFGDAATHWAAQLAREADAPERIAGLIESLAPAGA